MTERPDAEPRRPAPDGGASQAHDLDPTGVRSILSSLADPGPMPHDLVQRISASLAAEQARREQEWPLTGRGEVHSTDTAIQRRRSFAWRLPSVAIAASIVVLAGAVVLGVLAMGGLRFSASDSAGSDAAGGAALASEESQAQGGSDSGVAPQADRDAVGDGGAATEESMGLADQTSSDGVFILATGRDLTDATFVAQSAPVLTLTSSTWDPAAEERLMSSLVGSVAGATDCLSTLLDEPPEQVETRIALIDSVTYAGTPAALILLTDTPADRPVVSGPVTAYLVPLDCRHEWATSLREPARVG